MLSLVWVFKFSFFLAEIRISKKFSSLKLTFVVVHIKGWVGSNQCNLEHGEPFSKCPRLGETHPAETTAVVYYNAVWKKVGRRVFSHQKSFEMRAAAAKKEVGRKNFWQVSLGSLPSSKCSDTSQKVNFWSNITEMWSKIWPHVHNFCILGCQ